MLHNLHSWTLTVEKFVINEYQKIYVLVHYNYGKFFLKLQNCLITDFACAHQLITTDYNDNLEKASLLICHKIFAKELLETWERNGLIRTLTRN
uniref:Uncharacterized protein n=1 Tax=Onchocerca volvulus TaxID=6282 RepID=A0A8R1TK69_ONCVO